MDQPGRVPRPGRHLRHSGTNLRSLTEEECLRGKEQLRRAVEQAGPAARNEARTSWLELLDLR